MATRHHNILLIAVISLTQFGTQLASFLGFASIGFDYDDVLSLSVALALKTLFIALFSYKASRFVLKFDARKCVVITQISGIAVSSLLWFALHTKSPGFTLTLILISGIPSVVFANAMTILLRRTTSTDNEFKHIQAVRGTFASCTFIVAGMTWPILYIKLGWRGILVLDIFTFLVALALILRTHAFKAGEWATIIESPSPTILTNKRLKLTDLVRHILSDRLIELRQYFVRIILIYIGVGLIPLISSSNSFLSVGDSYGVEYLGYFWAVEATATFAANVAYQFLNRISHIGNVVIAITNTSYFFLYYGVSSSTFTTVLVCIFVGRWFMEIQAVYYRDQLIVKASSITDQVKVISFISSFNGLAMAISPMILYLGYKSNSLPLVLLGSGLIHVFVFIVYRYRNKDGVPT
jgi:hypothetical protein